MKRVFTFLTLMLFLASGCQKESITSDPVTTQFPEKHLDVISSLGFDTSTILDHGEYYLVEGDIMFDKTDLDNWSRIPTKQQWYGLKVTWANYIPIYIDTSVPNSWHDAINSAIEEWNKIDKCRVYFKVVTTAAQAQTVISHRTLQSNVVAQASWPNSNGDPGPYVYINSSTFNYYSFAQKKYTVAHELGHILGFMHFENGYHISGTPKTDNNSIMRSGTGGESWRGFSNGDILAAQILYPPAYNHQYVVLQSGMYNRCDICGWVYDPIDYVNYPGGRVHHMYLHYTPYQYCLENNGNIPAGTPFENLPDDFLCVACGVGKDCFSPWRPFCYWVYDSELGSPDTGVSPGTRWEDVPDGWECPLCWAEKSVFQSYHYPIRQL